MGKWTKEHDGRLLALIDDGLTAAQVAHLMDRSEGSVRARALKLKVGFNSTRQADLLDFLRKGRALVREDIGGVVGVRWCPADRSGGNFNTPMCETLAHHGFLARLEEARAVYVAAKP